MILSQDQTTCFGVTTVSCTFISNLAAEYLSTMTMPYHFLQAVSLTHIHSLKGRKTVKKVDLAGCAGQGRPNFDGGVYLLPLQGKSLHKKPRKTYCGSRALGDELPQVGGRMGFQVHQEGCQLKEDRGHPAVPRLNRKQIS